MDAHGEQEAQLQAVKMACFELPLSGYSVG